MKYGLQKLRNESTLSNSLLDLFVSVVSDCNKKTIQSFWEILRTNFNGKNQRKILRHDGYRMLTVRSVQLLEAYPVMHIIGQNSFFTFAMINEDDEAFQFVRNLICKTLGKRKLMEIISRPWNWTDAKLKVLKFMFIRLIETFKLMGAEVKFREIFDIHWVKLSRVMTEDQVIVLVEVLKRQPDNAIYRENLIHSNEKGQHYLYFAFVPNIYFLRYLWREIIKVAPKEEVQSPNNFEIMSLM